MSLIVEYYCSALLFSFQVLFFLKCALNKKSLFSKKYIILIISIFAIFYSLVFFYFQGVLKTLILVLITVFLYMFIYKISFFKSILLSFVYIVVLMIPDLLVLFCLTKLFDVSKLFYYNEFAGSFLADFTIFVIFILITFFLKKPLKKLFDTQIDTDKKIILLSIMTFVCVLLFFYTIVEKFRFTNDILLYLMCIFILLLVLSNLIKQVIDNRKLSDKYDKLLEFMTTYENEIEQQRILRHEIKNEFLVVRAKLLDLQKNEEVVHYIDEILKDKITVKQEKYAKFGYLPPGIKGLCYFKVQEAENKGIHVSINISKKIKEFDINLLSLSQQRDLARILGVFLDNAREASSISIDKRMGLEIYFEKDEVLKFIISNSFNNEINVKKMGKEAFSTKGKGRGHGLMLVNYILEGNKIFSVKTDISNNVYSKTLSVKIKNK